VSATASASAATREATALDRVSWPFDRLGEAIAVLARRAGLARSGEQPQPPRADVARDRGALARWVEAACRSMGFEAEPTHAALRDVDDMLRGAAPAMVRLPADPADRSGSPRFVALAGAVRRRAVLVIGPDHRAHRVTIAALRGALCRPVEAEAEADLDQLSAAVSAGGTSSSRRRTREALLRELRGGTPIGDVFTLRLSPGAPFWRQLRGARLTRKLAAIAAAHALQYALWVGSWWMLGRGALAGRLDPSWIAAWALLVSASHAVRLQALRDQGGFAIAAGALLRQRLLLGALRMSQDAVRRQGTGQLLGRVLESEALESLGLTGGLATMEAVIELVIAPAVLWAGAGGALHAALLLVWVAGTAALALRYHRARTRWTDARVSMTNDLVEALIGHRTRVAQEAPGAWNRAADAGLAHHVDLARAMDREGARFRALVARGWLIAGVAGIAAPFVAGTAGPTALAIGLGGVLLAHRALARLAIGMVALSGAAIAFRQIAPLHRAAARAEAPGLPDFAVAGARAAAGAVEAHDLAFRHGERGDPVLDGVSLRIRPGDRILLEGPSGGGKSTLAAVLSGLRAPESGALLIGGLDRATLGTDGWRRRVTTAPQFQDNHVLTETLLFNLLMGGDWPPEPRAVREAEAVCADLGLGPLLERMPAGILQVVGETGWQLSHGERSRLFIARALLQDPDLVILDENFGALDPENLEAALRCVLARARSLLVIAHP